MSSKMPVVGKMCARGLANINGFSHILVWASTCDSMTARNSSGDVLSAPQQEMKYGDDGNCEPLMAKWCWECSYLLLLSM